MRVSVTGAEGFIGSHLVEQLILSGHTVRAMVQYNSFNNNGWLDTLKADMLKEVEIVQSDIRDAFATEKFVEGSDAVLNLAALIAIPYSYVAPASYIETNIQGTLNVLEACRKLQIDRLVHTSTSEVYGTALTVPISESHPKQPQSPYSASKISADALCLSYHNSFDMPVGVLRPFNTFGPRQSNRAFIPTIINQILAGKDEIALGDVTPTRDLTYVIDTCDGFMCAIDNFGSIDGKEVNLGTGSEISVGDCAELIGALMGREINIVSDDLRKRPQKSEVFQLVSDNTLAKTTLKWKQNGFDKDYLEISLKKTIDWFSNPNNRKFYKDISYTI